MSGPRACNYFSFTLGAFGQRHSSRACASVAVGHKASAEASGEESPVEVGEVVCGGDDAARGRCHRRAQPGHVGQRRLAEQHVAVRVRAGQPGPRRVARLAKVEGREDPASGLDTDRSSGHPLDDQLSDDVVGVRVRVAAPGRKQRLLRDTEFDGVGGGPRPPRADAATASTLRTTPGPGRRRSFEKTRSASTGLSVVGRTEYYANRELLVTGRRRRVRRPGREQRA